MLKRWGLFILTNILVVVTINILLGVLGVKPYITESGIDYESLLAFCLVWGMAGSFISLLLSRQMAKWMTGVQVVDPRSPGQFRWLVESVHRLSRRAGLKVMPEVGVYPSGEVNAFATGPSRNRSLVAVSEGLLSSMSQDEIEGVLGHEVAHIANGDMVTMTLIQGVVNAFTMFLSRVISFAIAQNVEEEKRSMVQFAVMIVLDIVLGLLGYLVVCWFSRQREFRADKGASQFCGGPQKMVAALRRLAELQGYSISGQKSGLDSTKISGSSRGFIFSTHPPLETRIAALGVR